MRVKFFKTVQTINKKPIRILNYKFSIYSLVFRSKQIHPELKNRFVNRIKSNLLFFGKILFLKRNR
ncbi:hypothetical protein LEP1GSC172_2104 [Leptospira noguchii]|uniref:Uncharacterized protein n=1 Tax=Leptospira noguchii TaxID=28182 RepID=M6VJZ7_9LEPT|nr:hypothetical protein LEP1GSC172_2104 [Leptospira noguchii]